MFVPAVTESKYAIPQSEPLAFKAVIVKTCVLAAEVFELGFNAISIVTFNDPVNSLNVVLTPMFSNLILIPDSL